MTFDHGDSEFQIGGNEQGVGAELLQSDRRIAAGMLYADSDIATAPCFVADTQRGSLQIILARTAFVVDTLITDLTADTGFWQHLPDSGQVDCVGHFVVNGSGIGEADGNQLFDKDKYKISC